MKKHLFAGVMTAAAVLAGAASAQTPSVPEGYPADYAKIIEGSRSEQGLVIYSNMADNNWQPVLAGFRETYPWIKVETLDLGSGTVHSRWEAEAGSGSRTADILISGANDRWAAYGGGDGKMMDYKSPELAKLPDFANPYPGVMTLSTDPLVITYNATLLPEGQRPTGMASLVKLVTEDKSTFDGKITTYDAARNSFGLTAWWAYVNKKGDEAWKQLAAIGPSIRGEVSGGPMNEKIATGEYVAGIAVSGITIFPRLEQPGGELLGFAFPDDGTIMMQRGMGIPAKAANPNSAKLFVDYVLSNKGQTLIGEGGLVPYRDDVDEGSVRYTYQAIEKEVGKDNLIIAGFDKGLIEEGPAFIEKWKAAMAGR
ncbi:ABC transporter substrate-binding protein [Agaricicola taiwanensis]|uniref:ABC transporter substrate-binding protein n=1 Tax=Agaricicola taiwanensis TaxID=591372 RepID=A0A8J2YJ20_9RHOB|nr:extracellular solute-binding protein [Agaricicola taiwanensis]GGE45887.1 ABC transporter substrate-binding protein [Agaricicola taiwanensis]